MTAPPTPRAGATAPRRALYAERLGFALRTFIVCAFLGAVYVAVARLEYRAHAAPGHRVALGAWAVVQQPEWVPDEALLQLRTQAGFDTAAISVLDEGATEEVARRLAEAAPVRRVLAVERRLPNRLLVALELRRPVARLRKVPLPASSSDAASVAEQPDEDEGEVTAAAPPTEVWIDEEGVVLDSGSLTAPEAAELPWVVTASTVGTEPGDRFGDDVQAGLDLARRLVRARAEHPALVAVSGVDVSNWAGRRSPLESEVTLLVASSSTEGDPPCRVEWGRTGVRAGTDEPDFARKRDRLLRALEISPGLRDFAIVRVAFGDLYVVPRAESPRGAR